MFKLVVFAALIATAFGVQKSHRLRFDRRIIEEEFTKAYGPRLEGRIIGGESTTIEEYPYTVSLLGCGMHICGGAILNENTVVTAAHCISGITIRYLGVRAGSSLKNLGYNVINIEDVIQHQYFDYDTLDYDVAVLKLETSLTFGDNIQPIGLWTEEPVEGALSQVTGWGLGNGSGDQVYLHVLTVPIISRADCQSAYYEYITPRMICTQYPESIKGPCNGDAGGPLVTDGKLSGIVSWRNIDCTNPRYPSVYSNVAALQSFIVEHL